MKIVLHNFKKEEIINWLLNKVVPTRINNPDQLRSHKRRAFKFSYCRINSQLQYKLGVDSFARFFTLE